MDKPAILSNPENFAVVPVEGTPEMNSAWALGYYAGFGGVPDAEKLGKAAELVCFKSAHKAMFAACPQPTALSDIAAYCAELEAENGRLRGGETTQCCMCGKKGLSTVEGDGGTECELSDGRWVCGWECWERAVEPAPKVSIAELEARLTEAEGVIDRAEIASGLTSDGNLWRYWRGKTAALAIKFTALRAERDAAYRKGAEDMRERAAVEIKTRNGAIPDRQEIADAIRKLEAKE